MTRPAFFTAADLAEKFGVTVATVRKWLRDAGVDPAGTVQSPGRGRPAHGYSATDARMLAKEVGISL
jgi:predicted ArsR family transcriptional regulator